MTPQQRWARIQELCIQLEQSGDYSVAVLEASEPSEELRFEAFRLALAARAEAAEATRQVAPSPLEALPTTIGGYLVSGIIGAGGTGRVYAGIDRQGAPVAIKHLHQHLNQGETLARFERENSILKRLNHPHLIRVLDASVDAAGRPFLVMERFDGRPLDRHCDEEKLDVAARVRLLIAAAEAVQAAHENLVVHLDLKPANVVVSNSGELKVLDFGTAKLLDASPTITMQLTPSYASPEQLRGEPVTPRCDVYSLGLVAYELLCGRRAFGDRTSLAGVALRASGGAQLEPLESNANEAQAALRGTTSAKLHRLLRGDLAAIVAKSLEHDPRQRYASLADFAADLRRVFAGQPVSARPQTALYRAGKFLRRHPRAVAASLAVALTLAFAGGYAWLQARRADAAVAKSEVNSRFVRFLLNTLNPNVAGTPDLKFVDAIARASASLSSEGSLARAEKASIQASLANYLYDANHPAEARQAAELAFRWAEMSGNPAPMVSAASLLALIRMSSGDCRGAIAAAAAGSRAFERTRTALGPEERAAFFQLRGQIRANCQNDPQGQLSDLASAFAVLGERRGSEVDAYRQANLHGGYAFALAAARDYPKARAVAGAGLKLARLHPEHRAVRSLLHRVLASVEDAEGHLSEAAEQMGEATALSEGVTSEFEFLRNRLTWASRLAEAGDPVRARSMIDESLKHLRSHSAEVGQQRWMVLVDAALAYQRAGHCAPVQALVKEADVVAGGIASATWRGNRLAAEALCLVDPAQARPIAREALALTNAPPASPLRRQLAVAAQ